MVGMVKQSARAALQTLAIVFSDSEARDWIIQYRPLVSKAQ